MAGMTEHYGMTVWGREDELCSPAGINGNFEMMDGVMKEKAELVAGSYTGDGVNRRTVELGFTPKSVFICRQDGMTGAPGSYIYGGVILPGVPLRTTSYLAGQIEEGGFCVFLPDDCVRTNVKGQIYFYWVVR